MSGSQTSKGIQVPDFVRLAINLDILDQSSAFSHPSTHTPAPGIPSSSATPGPSTTAFTSTGPVYSIPPFITSKLLHPRPGLPFVNMPKNMQLGRPRRDVLSYKPLLPMDPLTLLPEDIVLLAEVKKTGRESRARATAGGPPLRAVHKYTKVETLYFSTMNQVSFPDTDIVFRERPRSLTPAPTPPHTLGFPSQCLPVSLPDADYIRYFMGPGRKGSFIQRSLFQVKYPKWLQKSSRGPSRNSRIAVDASKIIAESERNEFRWTVCPNYAWHQAVRLMEQKEPRPRPPPRPENLPMRNPPRRTNARP